MSSIITCLRNLFHQSTRPAETYMKASATKYQFQQQDLDRLRSIMHPDDLAKLQQEEQEQQQLAPAALPKKSRRK
jgi:hypothetical protein